MVVTDPSSYGSEKLATSGGSSRAPSTLDKSRADDTFALGKKGILVFFTLSVLTLMAALDGTSLSVALPVSMPLKVEYLRSKLTYPR